ncbi:hypothetical protein BDZ94DRAFT_1269371, partial [Collybia nuda]
MDRTGHGLDIGFYLVQPHPPPPFFSFFVPSSLTLLFLFFLFLLSFTIALIYSLAHSQPDKKTKKRVSLLHAFIQARTQFPTPKKSFFPHATYRI